MKKKKSVTVLVLIGILYAILPDPIPGPFDDLLLNIVLDVIAFVVIVHSTKMGSTADDAIANSTAVVNEVRSTVDLAKELKRGDGATGSVKQKVPEVKSF